MTTPQGMMELAEEIEKARNAYLDAISRGPGGEVEKRALRELLWDNKGTFAPALTPASAPAGREALEACRAYLVEIIKPPRLGSYVGRISSYHPCHALIDKIDAALALPAAPAGREALVEEVAQWLHDETDAPVNFPGYAWPLHPNDSGQRSADGWVHLVPIDVVETFR